MTRHAAADREGEKVSRRPVFLPEPQSESLPEQKDVIQRLVPPHVLQLFDELRQSSRTLGGMRRQLG